MEHPDRASVYAGTVDLEKRHDGVFFLLLGVLHESRHCHYCTGVALCQLGEGFASGMALAGLQFPRRTYALESIPSQAFPVRRGGGAEGVLVVTPDMIRLLSSNAR